MRTLVLNRLASSKKPSEGLPPQGAAACTGFERDSLGRGPGCAGPVCGNTRQRRQRRLGDRGRSGPRGGLEISSKQLLDSEQNFRKLVCWVSWWDEAVGMGGGWGAEHCSSCCQGVLGSNK